jgi:hypothetical protein
MVQRGVIEKVIVPNKQKKSANSPVKCFRLIENVSNDTKEDFDLTEEVIDATQLGNVTHIRGLQDTY